MQDCLLTLGRKTESERKEALTRWWMELNQKERFVFTKLLTGGWRVGVSQRMLVNALAMVFGSDPGTVAHRLMGKWEPTVSFYEQLASPESFTTNTTRPYPFFLAYSLDQPLGDLGPVESWNVEWK